MINMIFGFFGRRRKKISLLKRDRFILMHSEDAKRRRVRRRIDTGQ